MALNFNDIAGKKMNEVERPPLPPVGTYRFTISKLPDQRTTADENWDIVEFPVRVIEPMDDVDTDEYPGDLSKVVNRVSFMFNKNDEAEFEKTLFRLRTFLESHVGCSDADMSVAEGINASVNGEFLGTIGWRQDKNDEELFHANITRTAPVE